MASSSFLFKTCFARFSNSDLAYRKHDVTKAHSQVSRK